MEIITLLLSIVGLVGFILLLLMPFMVYSIQKNVAEIKKILDDAVNCK